MQKYAQICTNMLNQICILGWYMYKGKYVITSKFKYA